MTGAVPRGLRQRRLREDGRLGEEGARVHRPDPPPRRGAPEGPRLRRLGRRDPRRPRRTGRSRSSSASRAATRSRTRSARCPSFYRLGVRYMTLTHTNTNDWADSSGSFFGSDLTTRRQYAVHGGLTDFGPRGRARDEPARHARGRLARLRQDDGRRDRGLEGAGLRVALLVPRALEHPAQRHRRPDPGDRRERRRRDGQRQLALPRPEVGGRATSRRKTALAAEDRRGARASSRTTRRSATRRSRS